MSENFSKKPAFPPKQPEVVCIFGRRGSGKTTRARAETKEASRLIVWDPLCEYGFGECPGVVTETIEAFMDYPFEGNDTFRVVHRPIDDREEIEWVLRMAYSLGSLTLLLEELDTVCQPTFTPDAMKAVIRRGRHRGIAIVGVSRNPAEVTRDITRQAHRFILYGMHEPRDLEYFRSFGVPANVLPRLKPFQPYEHNFVLDISRTPSATLSPQEEEVKAHNLFDEGGEDE